MIVSGELENNKINIMNLYAPNLAQAKFLSSINILLTQFKDIPLLVGGDFNLVSNAAVDRSSPPLPADKALSRAFEELLQTHSLIDGLDLCFRLYDS